MSEICSSGVRSLDDKRVCMCVCSWFDVQFYIHNYFTYKEQNTKSEASNNGVARI